MHAREWVSASTATWILNELLTSTDPATRQIANTIDWYILTVAVIILQCVHSYN